ncbi:twin-arginine translocase TatA/TatE family subunit [Rhodanobacter sp. 115]|jgi:sec-independent protein translocase protein TatA|uniref:twin-arginine translocase TatA/TatE family subunit n=1 Tax=Rhodanobacter sp. FW021-MT20 TaxID=1162282 RepID=UPI000260DBAC|nr:twin-arginine translocase TatA/TatE family subunit [Rhodanobacter sp. 115]EIL86871.1 twin-arginine translocase subunit, sec-independent protein export [Rhodanobacter sp. 115]
MSIWHLLILAVVVLLIFGTGKLSKIGPDLGSAIRGFKKSLDGDDAESKRDDAALLRAEAQPADNSRSGQREPVDVKSR